MEGQRRWGCCGGRELLSVWGRKGSVGVGSPLSALGASGFYQSSLAERFCFKYLFILSKNLLFAVLHLFYIHLSNAESGALRFCLFNVSVWFMWACE